MKGKKAQVGTLQILTSGIVIVFILGAFLIFGLLMLEELKDETNTKTGTKRNESITPVDAGVGFLLNTTCGFDNPSVFHVSNKTSATTITSGNYSVYASGANWYIKNLTSSFPQSWNISYTYEYGEDVCDAADASILGLGKFGDYVDLIVLAIVISIVITLIIVGFAMKSRKQ